MNWNIENPIANHSQAAVIYWKILAWERKQKKPLRKPKLNFWSWDNFGFGIPSTITLYYLSLLLNNPLIFAGGTQWLQFMYRMVTCALTIPLLLFGIWCEQWILLQFAAQHAHTFLKYLQVVLGIAFTYFNYNIEIINH